MALVFGGANLQKNHKTFISLSRLSNSNNIIYEKDNIIYGGMPVRFGLCSKGAGSTY